MYEGDTIHSHLTETSLDIMSLRERTLDKQKFLCEDAKFTIQI